MQEGRAMKTIIAGSRNYDSYNDFLLSMCGVEDLDVTEVVSGGCRGVDKLGERWARVEGLPVKTFPADWEKHGKAAGPIRNKQMAEYANALIAFWDSKSRGTKSMIDLAKKNGLKVIIVYI